MKRINFKICVLMLVVIAILVGGCSFNKGEVVAVVNDEKIYRSELDEVMEKVKKNAQNSGIDIESEEGKRLLEEYEIQIVESLIEQKFLEQLAKKENISIKKAEVEEEFNNEIAAVKEEMGEEGYKEFLEENNLTEDDIKKEIEFQMLNRKLFEKVTSDVKVSDEEVKKFYDENKDSLKQIKVRHILFSTEEGSSEEDKKNAYNKAKTVIKELQNGGDFEKIAKEKSEEPGAKESGGLIPEFFTEDTPFLDPDFVKGAYLLNNIGDFSKEPVETQFGYHIIKLEEKKETFEDLKEDIRFGLLHQKQNEKYIAYYEEKRNEAKIENILKKEIEEKRKAETENKKDE